jgi:hypothetical protein
LRDLVKEFDLIFGPSYLRENTFLPVREFFVEATLREQIVRKLPPY